MNTININLKGIEELFDEPEFNPFDPVSRSQSGFDELVDKIRERSMKNPLRISLHISTPLNGGVYEMEVKKALMRYCTVKLDESECEIFQLRSQGKRDLIWALTLSFLFFIGAFFTAQLSFLPEFVIFLLSTGFGILAWVVLWPPLDNVLYAWRPYRWNQRIYRYIQSAALVIQSNQADN